MVDRFRLFSASIAAIHRDVQKIERDEMEQYGLKGSFAQYLVLLIQYPEGIPAARLTELSGNDKAAVSRTVAEMEEMGLICKKAEKTYRAPLTLTEEGRKAAEFVCRRAEEAVALAGGGLTDETRAVFYEALGQIAQRLHTVSTKGLSPKTKQGDAK